MKQFIANLFGIPYDRYKRDSNVTKAVMLSFNTMSGSFEPIDYYKFGVTDIKAFKHKDGTLSIRIVTLRPGIVIGKGGRTFNQLVADLKVYFKTTLINVDIKENKVWNFSNSKYNESIY